MREFIKKNDSCKYWMEKGMTWKKCCGFIIYMEELIYCYIIQYGQSK